MQMISATINPKQMAFITCPPSTTSTITLPKIRSPSTMSSFILPKLHHKLPKLTKFSNQIHKLPLLSIKFRPTCCSDLSPWEPSPVEYAPTDDPTSSFLKGNTNIFETLNSTESIEKASTATENITETNSKPPSQLQYLNWPMWLVGPPLLLATGMVPTLWLPISSIFIGPNIASLLSLTGLDCIFNLGASLFLLMADACARPKTLAGGTRSRAPLSYQLWNMAGILGGFIVPLAMLFGSYKGFLLPQLPVISFLVLLGPYLLLLAVQMLTEMLTWHWKSPVWLVTPVVYEAYRILQLMRGLKLGTEVGAPGWVVHGIRGLVCWWVLVLGIQLMRVAWYAGFTARDHDY